MKRNNVLSFMFFVVAASISIFVACAGGQCRELQLMGAGDRIHDSFTFANTGVVLEKMEENNYLISGSVDFLSDEKVKKEFDIDEDVDHVIVVKVCNCSGNKTVESEVEISVDGIRNYDAEHLNGTDYTYIILEAVPAAVTTVSVKWNKDMEIIEYKIKMADDLVLLQSE